MKALKDRISAIENGLSIKESGIVVWHKNYKIDSDGFNPRYTFDTVDGIEGGIKRYYEYGKEIPESLLDLRTNTIILYDVSYEEWGYTKWR